MPHDSPEMSSDSRNSRLHKVSHQARSTNLNSVQLQHLDTIKEVQAGCLKDQVGSEDELSTTDGTSTTYSTALGFPCPIVMNMPRTTAETSV